MPMTNTPRAATVEDASAISRIVARAFDDDPMMRWSFPDDATRDAALDRCFATLFTRRRAGRRTG
ncbi:hypothetical protein AB0L50_33900 [Streptomyces flaveolus]|uniref:hypothetical protein n=1 Tax=Streptomyces flaveolus TaxID=67297 RepID=UPI00343F1583